MLYLPAEFPLDPQICYLNHAAIGPWPRRTAQTVASFAQQNMMRGGSDYPAWLQVEQRLRARIARMINAPSSDDIALTKNTSEGLSTISQGLDWRDGDEIVGLAHDFCSNRMPWQVLDARGVRYRPVDALEAEDPDGLLIQAITSRTRLLAISSVHYATGYRFDLERIAAACRRHGVLLSVDVIQSLGAVPFDLDTVDADFVTCGGHKWLLAPEGLGFFYCRAALRDRLSLHQFGWAMREQPYDFEGDDWEPAHSARRFESGTPNMMGIHALDASLSLLEEFGMEKVHERLEANVGLLAGGLSEIPGIEILTPGDPERRAGIPTFRHPDSDQKTLHQGLAQAGVICAARAGGIRLAPHFYTPGNVISRAIETVSSLT
jgi:selenocysteine lyase/cysteine desulfurase